jgi:Extensin-like protein C-terminus
MNAALGMAICSQKLANMGSAMRSISAHFACMMAGSLALQMPKTKRFIVYSLRELRSSACGYFTTVLGPGTNAAHASHFHFDRGSHGKSGTNHICE